MASVDEEIAELMAQLEMKQQQKIEQEEKQRSEVEEEDSRRRLEESGLKQRYEQAFIAITELGGTPKSATGKKLLTPVAGGRLTGWQDWEERLGPAVENLEGQLEQIKMQKASAAPVATAQAKEDDELDDFMWTAEQVGGSTVQVAGPRVQLNFNFTDKTAEEGIFPLLIGDNQESNHHLNHHHNLNHLHLNHLHQKQRHLVYHLRKEIHLHYSV